MLSESTVASLSVQCGIVWGPLRKAHPHGIEGGNALAATKSATVCVALLPDLRQASVNEYAPTAEASTISAPFDDLLPPQSPEAEQEAPLELLHVSSTESF